MGKNVLIFFGCMVGMAILVAGLYSGIQLDKNFTITIEVVRKKPAANQVLLNYQGVANSDRQQTGEWHKFNGHWIKFEDQ